MEKFYITTSIPYVNASPHIGHALEFLQADVLARWHGLLGQQRWFQIGTDEHGLKNYKAAEDAGQPVEAFVQGHSDEFRKLAEILNVSHDDFIRTSDRKMHWPGVVEIWKRLAAAGDLYLGEYEGFYCVGCETFVKESDLVEGKCAIHEKEPEKLKEENWFFKLSKYGKTIKEKIQSGEFQIVPKGRQNEMISFIDQGLEDLSVSRPKKKLPWGIPVPGDDDQTMYIWVDALSNYLTGLGFGRSEDWKRWWPADVHVIGKDITRFHAIIWPAMLLSAGIDLPKGLLVHGFIQSGGKKMSKSIGNVVDPFALVDQYGVDPVRYYLLHEIPTTKDGDFTEERLREVYAADLQKTIGNLLARVTKIGERAPLEPKVSKEVRAEIDFVWKRYNDALEKFELNIALEEAVRLARFGNEFMEELKPWESDTAREAAIPQLALILHSVAWMLTPFLPDTAKKIFEQLGMDPDHRGTWDGVEIRMKKGDALFPRL